MSMIKYIDKNGEHTEYYIFKRAVNSKYKTECEKAWLV